MTLRAVAYEDRVEQLVGMKLLLLSLQRHAPGLPIDVVVPGAPDDFVRWLDRIPDATLDADGLGRAGFDVKPTLLLRALDEHGGTALWLDSDIIVTSDPRPLLAAHPTDHLVVTEEPLVMPHQGGRVRSQGWGLPAGRSMPATTNTSVVRVGPDLVPLLQTWHEFLGRSEYRTAQEEMAWDERPIHLLGDQEVLCALLEWERYSDVPVAYLRRGRDIAHCFHVHGYMFHQMVGNLARRHHPTFVHSHGAKPWFDDDSQRVHLDVSPYTLLAREYADALDEPAPWMDPTSTAGRRMVRLARGNPWTASLPRAAFVEVRDMRMARTGAKRVLGRR